MNNPPPDPARDGEDHRRRFPWLTAEDMRVLAALPPDAAREFEVFIRQQAAGNRAFAANFLPESVLGQPGALELAHGARSARWTYGTGGGRVHHPTPVGDS